MAEFLANPFKTEFPVRDHLQQATECVFQEEREFRLSSILPLLWAGMWLISQFLISDLAPVTLAVEPGDFRSPEQRL